MDKITSFKFDKLTPSELTPELGLHVYLIIFMSVVGLLKFAGFMKHKNSRLVGFLELIAGAVFLPGWKPVQQVTSTTALNLYIMAASMIMVALGIVTGDKKKRLSPICWGHAALTLLFCMKLGLDDVNVKGIEFNPLIAVALFMGYGHIVGRLSGNDIAEKVKTK